MISEVNKGARCEVCTIEATMETGKPGRALSGPRHRQRFLCSSDFAAWGVFMDKHRHLTYSGTRINPTRWQIVFDEFLKYQIREILAPDMMVEIKDAVWSSEANTTSPYRWGKTTEGANWIRGKVVERVTEGPFRGHIHIEVVIEDANGFFQIPHPTCSVMIPPYPNEAEIRIAPRRVPGDQYEEVPA